MVGKIAKGMGVFSIGLGLVEMLSPRGVEKTLGVNGKSKLVSAFGAREIGAGIGLLVTKNPAPWLWARVAGDALDLTALGTALKKDNPKRKLVGAAIGIVALITLADILTAKEAS